jgi:hypothetical protein
LNKPFKKPVCVLIWRSAAVLKISRSIFDALRLTLRAAALQEFQIRTLPKTELVCPGASARLRWGACQDFVWPKQASAF